MFVLGVDPGLSRCGYGVIEATKPGSERAVAAGVIRTDRHAALPERLRVLQAEIRALIVEHRPQAVSVERVFFQNNTRTAMSTGQASGIVLAEAAAAGCEVAEYTPTAVKSAVAGWGGAGKEEVTAMVTTLLRLDAPPRPADAADALALALTHVAHSPMRLKAAAARSGASR